MNPTTCVRYAAALALVVAATNVDADAFAANDKALWIDRHNYFRMTAVPFAAANMLRIKWSEELATQAQTDAATCAATGTGAGVNVALVSAVAGAVDESFTQWVVTPALAAFPKLAAPKAAGDAVGQGTYNSYSQVVWSSTNQVGCAYAACTGGKIGVACRYAPAGNDGTSPWYVHGPAGSACPAGTVSKVGLCVTSADDPSYNDIAPIAAGQNAYDVFKDFIPNMQKALKGEAVAPATAPTRAPAPASESTATPGATTAAPAAGGNATTPATTAPASAAGNTTQTTTTAPPATTSPSTVTTTPSSGTSDGTAPAPTVTKVVDGKVYVKVLPTTAPSTGGGSGSSAGGATTPASGGATPAPTVTKVVDGKVYVKVVPGTGSTAGASEPTVGDATPAPTVTKVVNGVVYVKVDKDKQGETVGTVKPGSGTGSTFTNQASNKPASAASTPAATDATAIGANNKSGANGAGEASFSAAGVAGIIVIGCVAIAGVAVFVSYRKNQQRQRDIMQNGGIHVL